MNCARGKTIVEKLLSRAAGKDVRARDVVVAPASKLMTGEGRTPDAMEIWDYMGKRQGMGPRNVAVFIDHMASVPTVKAAALHARLRRWARENDWQMFDAGMGISHGIFPERGWVLPGEVIACADGHSCTFGALNAYAASLSSSEVAIVLQTGKFWFEVPPTIRVTLRGRLSPYVTSKDVILHLVGKYGQDGANGHCVEFDGEAVENMSVEGRLTLANMVVEMGGTCGLMACNDAVLEYVRARADRPFEPVEADADATYAAHWELDVSELEPHVACPPVHDNVVPIGAVPRTPVSLVFLGSCTNGRYEDLAMAADVMRGRTIAPGVRMIVYPASRDALLRAESDGVLRTLLEAGAVLMPPGCGACAADINGSGVAGDDDVVIATSSRNYPGRMGSTKASIYLSSPAVAAASAIAGELKDPRAL